jgi:hypothetical protein
LSFVGHEGKGGLYTASFFFRRIMFPESTPSYSANVAIWSHQAVGKTADASATGTSAPTSIRNGATKRKPEQPSLTPRKVLRLSSLAGSPLALPHDLIKNIAIGLGTSHVMRLGLTCKDLHAIAKGLSDYGAACVLPSENKVGASYEDYRKDYAAAHAKLDRAIDGLWTLSAHFGAMPLDDQRRLLRTIFSRPECDKTKTGEVLTAMLNACAHAPAPAAVPLLILAIAQQNDAAAKHLLDDDPSQANARDGKSFTPLHVAARHGNKQMISDLKEAGANMNACNPAGHTALHLAAIDGRVDVMTALLDAGAGIDHSGEACGNSPLYEALIVKHPKLEVVRLLLQRGADRQLAAKSGMTPQDVIDELGWTNTLSNDRLGASGEHP